MRKYKQVKKSKDTFDMKELAEVEHLPPLRKTDQSGDQMNIVDFKLRKYYNDGDIFVKFILFRSKCNKAKKKAVLFPEVNATFTHYFCVYF